MSAHSKIFKKRAAKLVATITATIILVITANSSASVNQFFNQLLRKGNNGNPGAPPSESLEVWWSWQGGEAKGGMFVATTGTMGVASPSNKVGGLDSAAMFISPSGDPHLFSGLETLAMSSSRVSNKTWRYNTTNSLWSWEVSTPFSINYGTRGVESASNSPYYMYNSSSARDGSGNVWFFGGQMSGGSGGTLWKYNVSNTRWTYVAGNTAMSNAGLYETKGVASSTAYPAARNKSALWVDSSGMIWIFGGGSSLRNDLWKYNPGTDQWTWVSGSNSTNQVGTYGTRLTANAANTPGARSHASYFSDTAGNLWLFGGYGYSSSTFGNLNDLWRFDTSTNQWTWVSGSNTASATGVYGTLGVANSSNKPGARQSSVGAASGTNLYIFSGYGYNNSAEGSLNDMWRYDTLSDQWTWVAGTSTLFNEGVYGTQGVASASNYPKARRNTMMAADDSNQMWIYGGEETRFLSPTLNYSIKLADLWKFSMSTHQWTWMSGPDYGRGAPYHTAVGVEDAINKLSSLDGSGAWVDGQNNVWVVGGYGFTLSQYSVESAIWTYNPFTSKWRVAKLPSGITGSYGTKNVAASSNYPPVRSGGKVASKSATEFWMFGGDNFDRYNDLWLYDTATNNWTWKSGSNLINQSGIYGTKNTPSISNAPGARNGHGFGVDTSGALWVFGGGGYDSVGTLSTLNDLWKYNPSTDEWTWISGANTVNQLGTYGTRGVANGTNVPGARQNSALWIDSSNNIWVYGGSGYDGTNYGRLADLWRYSISTGQWTWVDGSSVRDTSAVFGTKGTGSISNTPGNRTLLNMFGDADGNLYLFGGERGSSVSSGNDLWQYNISSRKWTWLSGESTAGVAGSWGAEKVVSKSNSPSSRVSYASAVDSTGRFWMLNGYGYDRDGLLGTYLSDAWYMDLVTTAPATKLVWYAPSVISGGICTGIEVRRSTANRLSSENTNLTVTLGGTGSSLLYSDQDCLTAQGASTVIAAGTYSKRLYIKSSTPASYNLTADGGGLTQGLVTFDISIIFSNSSTISVSPTSLPADGSTTATVTITLQSAGGPVSGYSGTNFAATGSGNTLVQPSSPTNGSGVTTGSIRSTAPGTKTLSITTPSGLTATATVTFVAFPVKLALSGSATPTSNLCNAYTITAQNASNAATNVLANTTITLSGQGSGSFYTSSTCGTPTSNATIAVGTSSQTIYYKSSVNQALTFTASASGLTDGTLSVHHYVFCQVIRTAASGPVWTVPGDWNPSYNSIEVIGGGGGGFTSVSSSQGSGGGAGGGYSKVTNVTTLPAPGNQITTSVAAQVAAGSSGQPTFVCTTVGGCTSNSGTVLVSASGGMAGVATSSVVGGAVLAGTGFSGGSGWGNVGGGKGGGGGGAAGPSGAGAGGSGQTGGTGGNGAGGTAGNAGSEWTTAGSGGGGGGGDVNIGGGNGGSYGAGGGGTGKSPGANTGGSGAGGVVVITWYGATCS